MSNEVMQKMVMSQFQNVYCQVKDPATNPEGILHATAGRFYCQKLPQPPSQQVGGRGTETQFIAAEVTRYNLLPLPIAWVVASQKPVENNVSVSVKGGLSQMEMVSVLLTATVGPQLVGGRTEAPLTVAKGFCGSILPLLTIGQGSNNLKACKNCVSVTAYGGLWQQKLRSSLQLVSAQTETPPKKRVHFKFSLLSLFEVASCGGFFHFCLDAKVEQKIKAA